VHKNELKILIFFITISLVLGLLWNFLENQKKSIMTTNKNADQVIGQIYKLNNDSLKNDSSEIFWSDLTNHEFIYFGDAIQTQDESTVLIKLSNRQILSIEPETLVRFNKKDDDISLDLVQGEVKLTETIDNPAEAFAIDNSELPKFQNKKIFIKTPKGDVDSKKEKILKISKKRDSLPDSAASSTLDPKDEPLFIQKNQVPQIKFDDDSIKSQKLAVPEEDLMRQPTSANDVFSQDLPLTPQVTSPTLPATTEVLPLSAPKIKKIKLSADE